MTTSLHQTQGRSQITYSGWHLSGPPGARQYQPRADWMPEPDPGPEVPFWTSPWAAQPAELAFAGP